MRTCTTKRCKDELAPGDRLFCSTCRTAWRLYCISNNMHEVQVAEGIVKYRLIRFQERLLRGEKK